MEGLEISIISYTNLQNGVETLRFDSEYYLKEYVQIEKYIHDNKNRFSCFSDWGINIDCSAFYPAVEPFYGEGNIPFIRVQNVKEVIDYNDCVNIPQLPSEQYSTLKKVESGDIVITKGGSIGFVGYITQESYACRDLIFIKSSILSEEQSVFLYLYFSTDFAYKQLIRSSSQCAQPHLTITLVKNLDILKVSPMLMKECAILYSHFRQKYLASNALYKEAERLLLTELQISELIQTTNSIANKRFSDFVNSGRLDAEYYQPKYDSLFSQLSKFETKRLGDIVQIRKSIEPGSEAYQNQGIPFVRVSNLSKFGFSDMEIHLSPDEYKDIIRPKQNTILLSKDGSVGIAYKVEQDMDVITSGAILHLTIKDNEFMPDYLTLVLNSVIVGMQAERDAGGSIIQHWKPSEIENVIIPKLSQEIQQEITNKVNESFALRRESKRLLNLAKTAVETAIEQGENAALRLLDR